ncbi:hypothetical protein QJS10_CPA06g01753 [Acorus calamus]|uniref:Dynactin subunit 6 n=1 Tax=Acorus calamus TaxID=4465 RepID=A0AAV9ENS2_ACOCL|nr:hypothetical protein QJS10_CPA06g01753 [Acorus calamus]
MLGARIGASVIIDTIDTTDPSLVSIGDGAVITEGALVQGHEVKDGMIRFRPVKIGRKSSVGPYAVIQNGSIVGEEFQVLPLQKLKEESRFMHQRGLQNLKRNSHRDLKKNTCLFINSWPSTQLVFSALYLLPSLTFSTSGSPKPLHTHNTSPSSALPALSTGSHP